MTNGRAVLQQLLGLQARAERDQQRISGLEEDFARTGNAVTGRVLSTLKATRPSLFHSTGPSAFQVPPLKQYSEGISLGRLDLNNGLYRPEIHLPPSILIEQPNVMVTGAAGSGKSSVLQHAAIEVNGQPGMRTVIFASQNEPRILDSLPNPEQTAILDMNPGGVSVNILTRLKQVTPREAFDDFVHSLATQYNGPNLSAYLEQRYMNLASKNELSFLNLYNVVLGDKRSDVQQRALARLSNIKTEEICGRTPFDIESLSKVNVIVLLDRQPVYFYVFFVMFYLASLLRLKSVQGAHYHG